MRKKSHQVKLEDALVQDAVAADDPYAHGVAAWHTGASIGEAPYEDEDDVSQWRDGWLAAKSENGQFGVGA